MPFAYIARCVDDTLYVGYTEDLASREQLHNEGRGAKYTAERTPVRIVYAEEYATVEGAIARERQLKGWSHEKKEALIRDDRAALDYLSHRSPRTTTAVTWRDLLTRNCRARSPR